ncbi:MAG: DUF4062 domain-containing protein [Candidatus Omnitrophota bacterium]
MKYKVFISGVQKELKAERRAVKASILGDVLLLEHFDVFLFEDAPAQGKSPENAYLNEVRGSDVYIGLLGDRYGGSNGIEVSPTEAEFREAQKQHKEILFYIKGENGANDMKREAGVQKLIKEIKDSKAGYSYRRYNSTVELTDFVYESLITFLKAQGVVSRAEFDQRICLGAKFSDIDEDKVRWCLRTAREKRNYPISANASTEDVFTHWKLLKDGKLTNAAILLFGKEPRKFFDQAKIKCIQFSSVEVQKPFASYHIYEGNLFEQVDKAVGFVFDAIRFPVIQQEHTAQVSRPLEIPSFAIEEAIINAVVHRNYNTTSSVQVMVFLDRVEILNSGTLPPSLKLEDLKKAHTSHPANPRLASIMFYGNYVQEAGSGTMEIIRQCKEAGLAEPEFVSVRNLEFKTILPRNIFTTETLSRIGLNERQMKAVKYVKEHGQISNQVYQNLNKTTKRTASRDLADLVSHGVFQKSGVTGKGTLYELKNFSRGSGYGGGSGSGFGDGQV